MKGISISTPNDGKVVLSKEFFEREPIFSAAAKFTDRYYVGIQPAAEYNIEISIQPKKADDVDENIVKKFCNELIEQQVRHDLQNRFGKLREMIVEQAFYPLEKK
ncbi:MAG: His-Xaa-Ser system protein HxsD [Syntrophorhabdaceae bacterium]|nr:His-Xaa-Ser system protein HxsD [Syntrophorhabdaceae bacterium]